MHVCFNFNQLGQFKVECPLLKATGAIHAPTLAKLRITNGRQGGSKAPRENRRAFQLILEEAKEASDIVASTFLVNFIPTLLLFDYEASHSFVSLKFSKNINNAIGNLEHPLRVEIVDGRIVKASKFYCS